nr:FG-GAP repeat protein [uncultured Steroidobacter sp.]
MDRSRNIAAGLLFLTAVLTQSLEAAPAVLLETARLTPDDGAPDGGFGRAIAIDGDVAVVTANAMAPFKDSGPQLPGAAYVYERNSAGIWQQTARLTPQPATIGDLFGVSVAVEGNVIVVGAVFSNSAYVFEKTGSTWAQVAVLGTGGNADSANAVAIDGGVIAISDESPHGMSLYRRGPSGWAKIASYENGWGVPDVDYLGPDVDIAGRFAVHGSWGSDYQPTVPGVAFIYDAGENGNWANPAVAELTRPGSVAPDGFSAKVALGGSTALITGDVFERNSAGTWVHTDYIDGGGQALDADGQSVASSLVPYRFSTLHRRASSGWSHAADLVASDGAMLSWNSIDDGRVLATTPYRRGPAAAYLFELPTDLERPALSQDDFQDGDANGWATTPGSMFVVTSGDASLVYRQSNLDGNAAALLQSASGDDQSIQVDVTPRAFNGADRWFGLVARYTDANNYYYVTARSGGALELKEMIGGSYTTLASATLPVALGHTNRLRLEAVGDHVRVFLEDNIVLHVRESDLSGGKPGLMTYKTSADFDNVVFNANPANLAYVYDFESAQYQWATPAGSWERVPANGSLVGRQSDLSGNAHALVSRTLKSYGDQIVQADLRATQFSGADRWLGLMTRYVDDSNYHYITIRSSGAIFLRKLVDGVVHTFATAPMDVDLNRTYRVRLESIGTRLRAYIDGELILEAVDPNVTTEPSTAGVAMYKTAADVDNFLVMQP